MSFSAFNGIFPPKMRIFAMIMTQKHYMFFEIFSRKVCRLKNNVYLCNPNRKIG